jgi:hypothetical protein
VSTDTKQIVSMAWNFAHVLRDDGLSYMAYTEQITFLLFLKMADEQTRAPYNRKAIVPKGYDWPSLIAREGDALLDHYRHILEHLSKEGGMLGEIFKRAKAEIQNPAILRRLIAGLKRAGRLRQSILKHAFAGRLVPQDTSDEPAAKLLERIRKEGERNKHRSQNPRRLRPSARRSEEHS